MSPVQINAGRLWSEASSACDEQRPGQLDPAIAPAAAAASRPAPAAPGPMDQSRAMAVRFARKSAGRSTSGPIRWLKTVSIGRSSVSKRMAHARTDSWS